MSDYSARIVRRPGSDEVYGIIDLTDRQVSLIMGALATLSTDNTEVADGYELYSDLYDSVEQLDAYIELNPYVIGTMSGPDPTEKMRAILEAGRRR